MKAFGVREVCLLGLRVHALALATRNNCGSVGKAAVVQQALLGAARLLAGLLRLLDLGGLALNLTGTCE